MKIQADREQLLKGIQTVGGVVSEKSLLPILSNVVIETTKGGIQFLATDLKTSISHAMLLDVLQEGSITLPAKKLADIIREMPDGRIELVVEEGFRAKIFSGKTRYQILGFSKEDFPKLPSIQQGDQVELPSQSLRKLIQSTAFAAAQDDTRFVLNGCLVTVAPQSVRFVATDGHRLSWRRTATTSKGSWQVIVPTKTLHEILSILPDDESPVRVTYGENKLEFSLKDTKVVASLVEGQYPNVEDVLKRTYAIPLTFSTAALTKAIKRVSLVALDKSNTVMFHFHKHTLTLSAQTPELGEAKEDLEIPYDGQDIKVHLNYRYVLEALKAIKGDRLTLELNDGQSAVCLTSVDEANEKHIVMPIRSTSVS